MAVILAALRAYSMMGCGFRSVASSVRISVSVVVGWLLTVAALQRTCEVSVLVGILCLKLR